MTEMKGDMEGPVDKFSLIYIIFYWLGIGTLLPWNMFITVVAYWNYKFRTVEVPEIVTPSSLAVILGDTEGSGFDLETTDVVESGNSTAILPPNDLQKAWGGYLAVASMIPNVTFLILNGFFGHKFRTQPRLVISLIAVIILFIFTSVMVQVDTDSWQSGFLYLTLASVVCINVGAAIFQGGILGVAGKFPPAYMGAVFGGQAIGGIFASSCNLVFLATGASEVFSAFLCFVMSVVFLGTALLAYAVATRSEFYKHYLGEGDSSDKEGKPEDSKLLKNGEAEAVKLPVKVSSFAVIVQISVYALAVFLTFFVTLGCFPAISAQVKSTLDPKSTWAKTYFIPVSCFLFFNVGDFIGRFLAEKIQFPKPGKLGAWITLGLALLRFVFVPLFLVLNIERSADSMTNTYISSDVAYIIIMLLFSITNGYVGTICMMSGPQIVRSEEAQMAASLMVAFLGIGLASGAFMSNLFVKLI